MKQYSFNHEIDTAICQFIDLFNNMKIVRQASNTIQKEIHVPCLYGDRSNILKYEENRNNTLKLPINTVTIHRIQKDYYRSHSLNDNLLYDNDTSVDIKNRVPIPVTITFRLDTIAKYQSDLDQIFSNFAAHFNPSVYTVWKHPFLNEQIECRVTWENLFNIKFPTEVNTGKYRLEAHTFFKYQTYLFSGYGNSLPDSTKLINTIYLYSDVYYSDDQELPTEPKFIISG